MPKSIQETEFHKEVVQADRLVLVDVFATWCGPCKAMEPILGSMAQHYGEKLKIVKINVDEAPNLARDLRVRSVPTLLWVHNGEVMGTHLGAAAAQQLMAKTDEILRKI